MKRYLIVFLMMLCMPIVLGQTIHEEIQIKETGDVLISGETDLDVLTYVKPLDGKISGSTPELTSKRGDTWFFTYDVEEVLSEYSISIIFPEDVTITAMKASGDSSLTTSDGRQKLIVDGSNESVSISISYKLPFQAPAATKTVKRTNTGLYYFLGFLGLVVIVYMWRKSKKPLIEEEKAHKPVKELDEDKLGGIKHTLNETQLKILDTLLDQNHECSQTKIKHLTGIPKASLSRNIELMAQKEIISKFYNGTSNYVKIHPALYKNS